MKVYLSPSNQTNNLYADGKHTEQEVCYLIAQKVQDYLTALDIETKLGKPHDTISQRVKESNTWGSDYHICVHTNAGGGNGCEVYCWNGIADSITKNVYDNLSCVTPTQDRGIKNGNSLYEVKYTKGKCIYIECMFHDNLQECKFILSNIDDIAYSIASAFLSNDTPKQNIDNIIHVPTLSEQHCYRVCVGSFTTQERADRLVKELKTKYDIESWIVH